METSTSRFPTAISFVLLASCGGGPGGNSVSSPSNQAPPPSNASPGGIWQGTESVSRLQVTGLVDESGELHFLRSDDVQYVGTATVAGSSVNANIEGYAPLGTVFADGSVHGTGTVSGKI